MFFTEKILSQDGNYKSIDLLNFVQQLLRESRNNQARLHSMKSYYGWLQSRPAEVDVDLERYRTMVLKLSSASCAAIAVRMDRLTADQSTEQILMVFENLINEQTTIEMIENNIKNEKKKLCPELLSPDRRSSVSFVVN